MCTFLVADYGSWFNVLTFEELRQFVETASLKGDAEIDDSNSLSAGALRHLLKSLAAANVGPDSAYVEIGVFRGGTLLDVASAAPGRCIGIDNFSLFDSDGENEIHIRQRLRDEAIQNVELVSLDFEVAVHNFGILFPNLKVALLMVDGAHDYRSQLLALLGMSRFMATGGIIVVDDANYGHVRQAGYDFVFAQPEWEVAVEILTESHPDQGPKTKWWNGIQVLAKFEGRKMTQSELGRVRQSTEVEAIHEMVERFRETHEVFRHKLFPVALEMMDLVRDATPDATMLSELEKLQTAPTVRSRHDSQNVDVNTHQLGIRYRPSAHLHRLAR